MSTPKLAVKRAVAKKAPALKERTLDSHMAEIIGSPNWFQCLELQQLEFRVQQATMAWMIKKVAIAILEALPGFRGLEPLSPVDFYKCKKRAAIKRNAVKHSMARKAKAKH